MTGDVTAARRAVAVNFLVHGIVWGAWAAQIPLAIERLAVGPALFGFALLFFTVGAIIAMPLTGALTNHFGSRAVVRLSGPAFALLFLGPALVPSFTGFLPLAIAFGLATGSMDVSMNTHGLAIEKRLGRPTLSLFHALFSAGALIGAAAGGLLVHWLGGVGQAFIISALSLIAVLAVGPGLLPAQEDRGLSGQSFAWPSRASLTLGLLCFLALFAEGAILDWFGIFLRQKFTLDAAGAASGYALFSLGMAASRFAGDSLRQLFGAVRMVRASAALMACGMALALLSPWPALSVALMVFAGLGIGNIAPVLFAGGGRLEPDAPGRGIASVVSLGYAGFLAGPPVIGLLAQAFGLSAAMAVVVLAALIILAASGKARAAEAN